MVQDRVALSAPVGTHDVLPPISRAWEYAVATFAQLARRAGFGLVLTPMFEDVAVFNRGIGEQSDVARKEMYVFEDRGGRQYALRPEGTASIVRAFVQHHPVAPWKAWYVTPAFRYERPQAGRYRQHHQLGAEVLGSEDPYLDAEVISLAWYYFQALGLRRVRLLINSMGHRECRATYVEKLSAHLAEHEARLCDEHQKVWRTNALRVLDCKKEPCREVVQQGPTLPDSICAPCAEHFAAVTSGLTHLGIPWELAPNLVRGFDYYTRTTFEFVSDALDGSQNAVGGGGRYDQLAEELGGDPTPSIGFGSGIERVLLALEAEDAEQFGRLTADAADLFVVDMTGGAEALALVDEFRRHGLRAERSYDGRSMKAQLKAADRSGAPLALIVGVQEVEQGTITMRYLRDESKSERQISLARGDVATAVRRALGEE